MAVRGMGVASRLRDDLVDESFASYVLTSELVGSENALPLPSPVCRSKLAHDAPYARLQSKLRTNALFTNPDNSALYYIDQEKRLVAFVAAASPQTAKVLCTIPASELQGTYPEEPTFAASPLVSTDSGSVMRLLAVSDGQPALQILAQFSDDPCSDITQLVFSDRPHGNNSFIVLDAALSASGVITVATRAIIDHITPTQRHTRDRVEFVSESDHMDDAPSSQSETSEAPAAQQLEYRVPASLRKPTYQLAISRYQPKPPSKITAGSCDLYELESREFFSGSRDFDSVLLDTLSHEKKFAVISQQRPRVGLAAEQPSSPASPQPQPGTGNEINYKMEVDQEGDDEEVDLELLAAVRDRMSAYTSDEVVTNPLAHWKPSAIVARDEEDVEMFTGADGSDQDGQEDGPSGIFVFSFDGSAWKCVFEVNLTFSPILFSSRVGHSLEFAVGMDVHCRQFAASWVADSSAPLAVNEVQAFEAMNFIQQGKRAKQFLLADPTHVNLALVEATKFLYIYRKVGTWTRSQIPRHKSIHQVVEKRDASFVGARWASPTRFIVLTETHLFEYNLN